MEGGEEATVAFRIDRNRDNVDGLNLALQTPEKQELEVRRMHRIQVWVFASLAKRVESTSGSDE